MAQRVSIIMYHYVRDTEHSEFPGMKALSIQNFRAQLGYIQKHYMVITMEALLRAATKQIELPARACLLTFDDGLKDHTQNVLPILKELKLQGSFFAPGKAVLQGKILDVQKIQHILASAQNINALVDDVRQLIDANRLADTLSSADYYFQTLAQASRFDSDEVVFVKRALQRELPMTARHVIVAALFKKYVAQDETSFSRQLYMNRADIAELQNAGMFIGSHGFEHDWLGAISRNEQEAQVDLSVEFLNAIGCDTREWVMCYPYGSYNESLLELLRKKNCVLGLTASVAIADLKADNPLTLPRLDTIDLPTLATAPANEWTKLA